MTELVDGYTPDAFPYRGILEELTERARDEQMTPLRAYAQFLDERDRRCPNPYFDYASTSITTGGHALYMPGIGDAISANTRTAREMVTLLDSQGTLLGERVVLPVDMGKTGWSQSDYMAFWGLVIAGPDVRELRRSMTGYTDFERRTSHSLVAGGVELMRMNDAGISREEKRPQYARFVDAYAAAIGSMNLRCLPAYRVVSLVDPEISLGCWAEKRLANRLGIPTQRVAPVKLSNIDEAIPFEQLRRDMNVITAAGGSICVAPRGSILTLVCDEAV